jgi:hypothetical protein
MKGVVHGLTLLVLVGACDGEKAGQADGQRAGAESRDQRGEERSASDDGTVSMGDPYGGVTSPGDTIIGNGNATSTERASCAGSADRRVRGSGKLITEERPVGSFTSLRVSTDVQTELHLGDPAVTLHIDDNLTSLLATEVSDTMLAVENCNPDQSLEASQAARVLVAAPQLDSIEVLDNATLSGATSSSGIELRVSDNGDLSLEVAVASALRAEATANARVDLTGKAPSLVLTASGNADVTSHVLVDFADITVMGNAGVTVEAARSIRVRASGNADVRIRGNPVDRDVETSGDAKVSFEP